MQRRKGSRAAPHAFCIMQRHRKPPVHNPGPFQPCTASLFPSTQDREVSMKPFCVITTHPSSLSLHSKTNLREKTGTEYWSQLREGFHWGPWDQLLEENPTTPPEMAPRNQVKGWCHVGEIQLLCGHFPAVFSPSNEYICCLEVYRGFRLSDLPFWPPSSVGTNPKIHRQAASRRERKGRSEF